MTTREKSLLILAVAGFVVPNVMVGIFIADHGLDLELYFESWFETLPSAQLVVDLVIAFLALVVWASWDGPRSPASTTGGSSSRRACWWASASRCRSTYTCASERSGQAAFSTRSCALVRPTLRVKPWLRKRLVPR